MPKQLGTLNLSRQQGKNREETRGKRREKYQRRIPKQAQITSNLITELSAEANAYNAYKNLENLFGFFLTKKKIKKKLLRAANFVLSLKKQQNLKSKSLIDLFN